MRVERPERSVRSTDLGALGVTYGLSTSQLQALETMVDMIRHEDLPAKSKRKKELPNKLQSGAVYLVEESLCALEVERARSATEVADIGPGLGFPGLVLAAVMPAARVSLIELDAGPMRVPAPRGPGDEPHERFSPQRSGRRMA